VLWSSSLAERTSSCSTVSASFGFLALDDGLQVFPGGSQLLSQMDKFAVLPGFARSALRAPNSSINMRKSALSGGAFHRMTSRLTVFDPPPGKRIPSLRTGVSSFFAR